MVLSFASLCMDPAGISESSVNLCPYWGGHLLYVGYRGDGEFRKPGDPFTKMD